MKDKILFSCCFLLLTGCLTQPQYYPSTQDINIEERFGITDAKVLYQDSIFKSSETISVNRSYSDEELIIKKDGFKDYHLKLKSEWTDEKWGHMDGITDSGHDISARYLFVPLYTMVSLAAIPVFGIGLLCLPLGVAIDTYNILIGGPSTAVVNPWRKFTIDEKILLEPTEQYEKECHAKKDTFISNLGCIPCDTWDEVVATESECNRCAERTYYTPRKVCAFPKVHDVLKNSDTKRLVNFYNHEYKTNLNHAYWILEGLKEHDRQDVLSIIKPCITTDKPIKDISNGSCHNCWEKQNIVVDREYYDRECHTQRIELGNISRLNPCTEIQIIDKDMNCHYYDEENDIQMPADMSERTKKLMCEKYCNENPHDKDNCRHLNKDGVCIKGANKESLG